MKPLFEDKQKYLGPFAHAGRFPTGSGGAVAASESFGLPLMVAYQGGQHKRSDHTTSAGCALQKRKRNIRRKVCKMKSHKS